MVPAWPSSTRTRAWVSDIQEVEAPWPLAPGQKDTQRTHQEQEDTNRWLNNREGKAYEQGTGEHVKHNKKPLGTAGTGVTVEYGRGGAGVSATEPQQTEGGREYWKGEPLGAGRDLGSDQGQKRRGK